MHLPKFQNPELLAHALTHRSYAHEQPQLIADNQRLEFLGDSVLNFVVGAMLYDRYPQENEGDLTRRRAALVDAPSLAKLAIALHLDQKLKLGKGAEPIRQSVDVLCDTFEAAIGAYYLDTGMVATQSYIHKLFSPLIEQASSLDPKTQLQQWVQQNLGTPLPEYRLIAEIGQDHAKTFTIQVWIQGRVYGVGQGKRKQDAEKAAAQSTLEQLNSSRIGQTLGNN